MPHFLVSDRLEKRAREIVAALGDRWSRNRGMGRCPAHNDRTPSLSVSLGTKAILFHCFAGCSNAAVLAGLERVGIKLSDLFDGRGAPPIAIPRKDVPSRNAARLWRAASTMVGTLAETYLARRGIALHSSELRFHPRTPFGPEGATRFLPAMLAAVRNDESILAVHRTYVDPATGRIATFFKPKRALGSLGTGAVRLAKPRGGRLGLAEGIESALSAMQLFGIPCWATLGNERFGLVTIPESVTELHLFVDADAGGELAEQRAREAYARDGRTILTHRPDIDGADWNDILQMRQPAQV